MRQLRSLDKILISIALVIIIIAGSVIYIEYQRPSPEHIPAMVNPSLVGISENQSNTTYKLNFNGPPSISPGLLQIAVSSGSYLSTLAFQYFSGKFGFQYFSTSPPAAGNITNMNGSSEGIFPGALITILQTTSLDFTKSGSTVEIIYDNRIVTSASLPPISLTGSLTCLGTYKSTNTEGENMTVAKIYMDISPSPPPDAMITVSGQGVTNTLEAWYYTATPSWPTNSSEITFGVVPNSTTQVYYAYTAVASLYDSPIATGNILYIAASSLIGLNGVEVTIFSPYYQGSIEVTL